MRYIKKAFTLIPLLILWLMFSIFLWGFVFNLITDAPPREKITLCVDAETPGATELAVLLEEKLNGQVRMVKVRSFDYAMFDSGALTGADLFIVPASHAEIYQEWFLPMPEELRGQTLYGCGKCTSSCPKTNYAKPLAVDAEDFLRMPSAAVTRLIKGTALEHTGTTVLKRNAAAAIGQQLPPDIRDARKQELLALCASPTVRQTIEAWP